jgi:hypothetical protein
MALAGGPGRSWLRPPGRRGRASPGWSSGTSSASTNALACQRGSTRANRPATRAGNSSSPACQQAGDTQGGPGCAKGITRISLCQPVAWSGGWRRLAGLSRGRGGGRSTRPATPSLARMLETCAPAVLGLTNNASAIWRLLRPLATRASASRSRGVRPSWWRLGGWPTGPAAAVDLAQVSAKGVWKSARPAARQAGMGSQAIDPRCRRTGRR